MSTDLFLDYDETTVDPGWWFIVTTTLACLLLHIMLPCLVGVSQKYDCRWSETESLQSPEKENELTADSILGEDNEASWVLGGDYHETMSGSRPITTRDQSSNPMIEQIQKMNAEKDEIYISGSQKIPKQQIRSNSESSRCTIRSESALSRLEGDEVSFKMTEVSFKEGRQPSHSKNSSKKRAWMQAFDQLVKVATLDAEMSALCRVAIPLSAQSASTSLFALLDISLLGHMAGAQTASVFVVVSTLSWTLCAGSYGFFNAIQEHFVGASREMDFRQIGRSFNAAIFLFSVGLIPSALVCSAGMESIFRWFGFENDLSRQAQEFAYLQVMLEWMVGLGYGLRTFLETTQHPSASSLLCYQQGFVLTLGVLVPCVVGHPDLIWIGICRLVFCCFHIFVSMYVVSEVGWLECYAHGGLGLLPHLKDIRRLAIHGFSSGVMYFFTYCQWECLLIFASLLGPAEVAVWATCGHLWNLLRCLSDGIGEAAEIRGTMHIISGKPSSAQIASKKSLFLGIISSLLTVSILFLIGDQLVKFLSPNLLIQRLLIEILPLLGLGHLFATIGSISWSILSAQGQGMRPMIVQVCCSWSITLPIATLFSYGLRVDLQGLVAALVLGLSCAGSCNTFTVLRSSWYDAKIKIQSTETFPINLQAQKVPSEERSATILQHPSFIHYFRKV